MITLSFVPGRNYKGSFYYPGCLDSRFNIHSIYTFNSVAIANVRGFRYFKEGIAASWRVSSDLKKCWISGSYCHNPDLHKQINGSCRFCSWITARDLIFDVIGDRPVAATTSTPAIDGAGQHYGYHCHSGNHLWHSPEDAGKCCSGKYRRLYGRWEPIAEVTS